MAASTMCAFTSPIATSRLWKIPAASAADAAVLSNTSLKWSGQPAPLEAMTGMVTACATASTRARSKPCAPHHRDTAAAGRRFATRGLLSMHSKPPPVPQAGLVLRLGWARPC